MAARPFTSEEARPAYSETAGLRLLSAVEGAGHDPFTTGQAVEQGAMLGISPAHVNKLLHLLATGGWTTRVKKGVYAFNDSVTKQPKAHTFAIGTALVSPSAISHWSALQHWGLTEQVPSTVMLTSPKRTFPPGDSAGRAAWSVAGVRYEVISVGEDRFFGISRVWVSERNQIAIFDRERALLDAFHHFHVFGSLSTALEVLDAHLTELDIERLVGYAIQLGVGIVVKRVGWSLERLDVGQSVIGPLRAYPVKGYSPLDPGKPARGRHNTTWHVIENMNDSQE